VLIAAGFVLGCLVMGSCMRTGGPEGSEQITWQQLRLVTTQLEALQEQVAATGAPRGWALLAFIVSLLGPAAIALGLVWRAERAAIHTSELLVEIVRYGLPSRLIDASRLLEAQNRRAEPPEASSLTSPPEPKTNLPP